MIWGLVRTRRLVHVKVDAQQLLEGALGHDGGGTIRL